MIIKIYSCSEEKWIKKFRQIRRICKITNSEISSIDLEKGNVPVYDKHRLLGFLHIGKSPEGMTTVFNINNKQKTEPKKPV